MTNLDDPRNGPERWDRVLSVWLKLVNLAVAVVKLARMVF